MCSREPLGSMSIQNAIEADGVRIPHQTRERVARSFFATRNLELGGSCTSISAPRMRGVSLGVGNSPDMPLGLRFVEWLLLLH